MIQTKSNPDDIGGAIEPLALRPKQAAEMLGIGVRTLWTLTNQGIIPHVRFGKAVRYPVHQLREWLAEEAQKNARN